MKSCPILYLPAIRYVSSRLAASLLAALLTLSPAFAADDEADASDDNEVVVAPESSPPSGKESTSADSKLAVDEGEQKDGADNPSDKPTGKMSQIGAVQNNLRRAKKNTSFFEKISDQYGDFKTRMEEEHGLSWSFSLSYRQHWVNPSNIGTASQTLFWPSLNWNIFDSETWGAGSFQFLYYGERRSDSKISIDRRFLTFTGEIPDYQNRFSQITYTQTLPGEKVAIAVGQYSFFNFDNNDYLADQQFNFVNTIFSANGSSTYPVTGLGAYVQFNASKTLQFLIGSQSVNQEDSSKRPENGIGSGPYAWLGYVQWNPNFKKLGDAQYSLTLYEAPPIDGKAASKGWSLNAMQNLSDKWAVFGRANASSDDADNSKRSYGLGFALNNPLGRSADDQIGVAYGSLEEEVHIFHQTLKHTQDTLEVYWAISLLEGLLLTPDLQYIRHPAFANGRNSATIFSLRTTLAF